MKMKRLHIAGGVAAAALIVGGAGACGSDDPATPPQPSQAPVESPAKPSEPKPQRPTQAPGTAPQDTDTDNRPLPEECKHPAGVSVRESCIEEFGPDGVGTVAPVPPERDRNNDGIDDSVEEPQPSQEEEPGPSQDEEQSPSQDEEPGPSQDQDQSPSQDEEPQPSQDEEQVPPTEEQIEQCTEQTGSPEACREKIDPFPGQSGR